MTLGVFAYGSLVARASLALTLGREATVVPAALEGWRRRWSLARNNARAEKSFAALNGEPVDYCLALNLEPAEGDEPAPNGAVVALSEAELRRLDLRELRYERVDVSAALRGGPGGLGAVYAYVAKEEHYAPAPPPRSIVIAAYLRACEEAFAELGAEALAEFRRTTPPPPVPVVEAQLVRDRIPEGNPRRW